MAGPEQPATAAAAAARVSRAGAVLGCLGLASSLFVVMRLLETWHGSSVPRARSISVLGQTLSYPTANFAAVVVLVLALLGLAVTVAAITGMARELTAARRFERSVPVTGRVGDALVIADDRPRAFCAGLLRPRIYVSSGAVAALDATALQAVLLHERHHARCRDPLRLACGRVAARALFFIPGLGELVARQQTLAELSADETTINAAPGNRSALARAMLGFYDGSRPGDPVGIDPARIDHVLGEPPDWRFPVLLCLPALAVIAVLAGLGALAGAAASGSATLAPPLLSSRPCIMVLAAVPGAMAFAALRLRAMTSHGAREKHAPTSSHGA
ncbi:MAG: M56 family metallopeptidase [Solirubrobacteraceae bacterium]